MYKVNNKNKSFIVLGAGGTGSWLIPALSKMADNIILVDGDTVEEKNVSRQNFFESEIGKNKAEVIGHRYGITYVTDFLKSTEELEEILDYAINKDIVIVGCLDNNATRHLVHDVFKKRDNLIWIDSGNAERHGQSYVAIKDNGSEIYKSPIELDEAFSVISGDERRPDQISCAEQSESASQNITANITAASTLLSLCAIVNIGGVLMGNKFSWDTRTVTAKSEEEI